MAWAGWSFWKGNPHTDTKPVPPATPLPPTAPTAPTEGYVLTGPLRYLIGGGDIDRWKPGDIVEVGFDVDRLPQGGLIHPVAYINALDEKYGEGSRKYGPYLTSEEGSTAADYGEGTIDPEGPGFEKNLRDQFARRKAQGFRLCEIDNPDSYTLSAMQRAHDIGKEYGFRFFAKNPGLGCLARMGDGDPSVSAYPLVVRPDCIGMIVEKSAVTPRSMHELRVRAGKPLMPIRFVAFQKGDYWAQQMAIQALEFINVGVTYSRKGEYTSVEDYAKPKRSPETDA